MTVIPEIILTQNIHATFELQGLFDNILRLLGNISQQTLHCGGIDVFRNNNLYLLCHCLDLKEEKIKMIMFMTDTGSDAISYITQNNFL